MENMNKVLYNVDQTANTTEAQKAQARENIGVDLSTLATKAELAGKQDALTPGANIQISGENVISATDTTYTAGQNVTIEGNVISAVDTTYSAGDNVQISGGVISATDTTYTAGTGLTLSGTEFSADTAVLQPKLTAGSNVQINGSTISATDTTYSAGANVQISASNEISATDTTYSAGNGLALNGTTFSVDTSVVQPKLTAGANITIVNNVISATGGGTLPPSTSADEGKVLTVDEDGLPEWRSLGEDSTYAIANGSVTFTPDQYYTNGRVTLSDIRSNGIEYAYNHDGWVLEKDHTYVIAFNIVAFVGYPESGNITGRIWLDGFQETDQVWKFSIDTAASHDESLVGSAIVCPQSTGEVHLNIRYDSPALAHIPSASVNKAEIVDVTARVSGAGVFVAYWSGYGTGHGNTTYTDIKAANDAGKCVLMQTSGGGGSTVYYALDNIDSVRAMFRRVASTYSNLVTVYASDDSYVSTAYSLQAALSEGTGIDITNNVVSWDYSVGRNLYLNTNKEIQTDIPGGKLHPTSSAWAEVGDLGAVYKVIARANGTGTYEVGLRYTGSGVSTTYTFIGKSFTTLGSSPSMSFSKIANVAATLEYSTAFGPAFNPSSMESVTIEGTLILARMYDFRAVMYSDENGDVQVAFTAVEVGH